MTEDETQQRIDKVAKDMEEMNNNYLIDNIEWFLEGSEIDILCDLKRYKTLLKLRKIHQIGVKFRENQKRNKKYWRKNLFLTDTKEHCEQELWTIKRFYSRATYFRYLKLFRDRFQEEPILGE